MKNGLAFSLLASLVFFFLAAYAVSGALIIKLRKLYPQTWEAIGKPSPYIGGSPFDPFNKFVWGEGSILVKHRYVARCLQVLYGANFLALIWAVKFNTV